MVGSGLAHLQKKKGLLGRQSAQPDWVGLDPFRPILDVRSGPAQIKNSKKSQKN